MHPWPHHLDLRLAELVRWAALSVTCVHELLGQERLVHAGEVRADHFQIRIQGPRQGRGELRDFGSW